MAIVSSRPSRRRVQVTGVRFDALRTKPLYCCRMTQRMTKTTGLKRVKRTRLPVVCVRA